MFNELAWEIHKNAMAHGWWEGNRFVEVAKWFTKNIYTLPDIGGGLCVRTVWLVLTQDMHSRNEELKKKVEYLERRPPIYRIFQYMKWRKEAQL